MDHILPKKEEMAATPNDISLALQHIKHILPRDYDLQSYLHEYHFVSVYHIDPYNMKPSLLVHK